MVRPLLQSTQPKAHHSKPQVNALQGLQGLQGLPSPDLSYQAGKAAGVELLNRRPETRKRRVPEELKDRSSNSHPATPLSAVRRVAPCHPTQPSLTPNSQLPSLSTPHNRTLHTARCPSSSPPPTRPAACDSLPAPSPADPAPTLPPPPASAASCFLRPLPPAPRFPPRTRRRTGTRPPAPWANSPSRRGVEEWRGGGVEG
jgi:hypothetical protein